MKEIQVIKNLELAIDMLNPNSRNQVVTMTLSSIVQMLTPVFSIDYLKLTKERCGELSLVVDELEAKEIMVLSSDMKNQVVSMVLALKDSLYMEFYKHYYGQEFETNSIDTIEDVLIYLLNYNKINYEELICD